MVKRTSILLFVFCVADSMREVIGQQQTIYTDCNDAHFSPRNPCLTTCGNGVEATCISITNPDFGICSCDVPCYTGTPTVNPPLNQRYCSPLVGGTQDLIDDCTFNCFLHCGGVGQLCNDEDDNGGSGAGNWQSYICNCPCPPQPCPTPCPNDVQPTTDIKPGYMVSLILIVITMGVKFYLKIVLFFLKISGFGLLLVAMSAAFLTFGLGVAYLPYFYAEYFSELLNDTSTNETPINTIFRPRLSF